MMQVELHPFPGMPHPDVGIRVGVFPGRHRLRLKYRVSGSVGTLALPAPQPSERADMLWEHSCFEAFLRPEGGTAYLEFNFSPSRQWAIYAFDSYRRGMRNAMELEAPRIGHPALGMALELDVTVSPPMHHPARLGLSAVIEEKSGRKSYWALAHPAEKPDFHDPDCFALDLPAMV